MKKLLFVLLIFLLITTSVFSQAVKKDYRFISSGNLVQDKNFYILTLFQQQEDIKNILLKSSAFNQFVVEKNRLLSKDIKESKSLSYLKDIMFSARDIEQVKSSLGDVFSKNRDSFKSLISNHLRPSQYFNRFDGEEDSVLLVSVVEQALYGLNHIYKVYGFGLKGKFSEIDSASYDIKSENYKNLVAQLYEKTGIAKEGDKSELFFEPSLRMAMHLLKINKRDEAARYEPMEAGENKKAFEQLQRTKWKDYEYAVILVPGNGPKANERLSENAKKRLKSSVERYNSGLAPFIMISGGNVHPFQTPYNEAIEMKKELMTLYNIPEKAIIMEPHARHTTTNLRNANRIVYRYGFPIGKKILITTDKKQAAKIADPLFVDRCIREIGHVPFFSLKKTSEIDLEYIPVLPSLYMDSTDPLDP
ncbi:YdcF family protein [Pedobacter xixiisoli]|uniref:DUF218 domain-containing protein n=1 Tax=Pedobacter xixiisoli TaxID=1476464 RepID=A0A286AD29_9SPHI|nr:YdcF family protein [Pedobacter xixiisoli]SOD19757.1 DUF218 domain-containing protein [Pedobacter xixiisoli]